MLSPRNAINALCVSICRLTAPSFNDNSSLCAPIFRVMASPCSCICAVVDPMLRS